MPTFRQAPFMSTWSLKVLYPLAFPDNTISLPSKGSPPVRPVLCLSLGKKHVWFRKKIGGIWLRVGTESTWIWSGDDSWCELQLQHQPPPLSSLHLVPFMYQEYLLRLDAPARALTKCRFSMSSAREQARSLHLNSLNLQGLYTFLNVSLKVSQLSPLC